MRIANGGIAALSKGKSMSRQVPEDLGVAGRANRMPKLPEEHQVDEPLISTVNLGA